MLSISPDLEKYLWKYWVLIIVIDYERDPLMRLTRLFLLKNKLEVKEKHLKFLVYNRSLAKFEDTVNSPFSWNKGLWLFGLDGKLKDYSNNRNLLSNLFKIIDNHIFSKDDLSRKRTMKLSSR